MCCNCINRREFLGLTTAGIAGASVGFTSPVFSDKPIEEWEPDKPMVVPGKTLKVQPVLTYRIAKRELHRSWREWGGVQTEQAKSEEVKRISKELNSLSADFPLKINRVAAVKTPEEAVKLRETSDYDVMVIYAAQGRVKILDELASEKKHNIIFMRHRSGPIYDWYENIHNVFLRRHKAGPFVYPAGMDVDDCVVDEYRDLLWRLQAFYGIKNFIGSRIVTLGKPGGTWEIAQEKYKIDIKQVSYEELEKRIKNARANSNLVSKAEKWTEKYLSLPDTVLITERKFVVNAFILYSIFKDFMRENEASAFTIRNCMRAVMPIAETTACLSLSLINDEGYLAFCESDFKAIPCGILMRYISGKPVFLNDPTLPHHGIVTAAHCSMPRRMDGKNYSTARVVTHFESDYGAAPKVRLNKGEEITMVNPDSDQKRWVCFKGTIDKSPSYDICRSQYDIVIEGDWDKFLREHRGFHWMMVLGDYTKEIGYAARKIGLDWLNVSKV